MEPICWWQRFLVGLLAGAIMPAAKLYGVSAIDGQVLIGMFIPALILAIFMGFYAVVVERNETDMSRLFRMCLAMPALVTNMTGQVAVKMVEPAEAVSQVYKCEPSSAFMQGVVKSVEAISNNKAERFLILSKEKPSEQYVLCKDARWYILGKTIKAPDTGVYYDTMSCQCMEVKDGGRHVAVQSSRTN